MSTFLQLTKDLHNESGAAGSEPTTVDGLTGESRRIANWIIQADELIQLEWTNWKFLRQEYSQVTVASNATIAKPGNLKNWDFKTFKIIQPGETDLNPFDVVEFDKVKSTILDITEGEPWRAIVMPDNSLRLEPIPDAIYIIEADYYDKPTLLAANGDISLIPVEYHRIILGRALILYANFENAPEQKDQGEEIYTLLLARLENDQLPNQEYSRFTTGAQIEVIA